jgi:hypothetical protein
MKPEDGGTMVPGAGAGAEVGTQTVSQCCRRARGDAVRSDSYETGNDGRKLCWFTVVKEEIYALFRKLFRENLAEREQAHAFGEVCEHCVGTRDGCASFVNADALIEKHEPVAKAKPSHGR